MFKSQPRVVRTTLRNDGWADHGHDLSYRKMWTSSQGQMIGESLNQPPLWRVDNLVKSQEVAFENWALSGQRQVAYDQLLSLGQVPASSNRNI